MPTTNDLFDPTRLPGWQAWSDALSRALDGNGPWLKRPANLVEAREGMAQTFPPVLVAMAGAYRQARARSLAYLAGTVPGIEPDPDPEGPSASRVMGAVEEPMMVLVKQVLQAGLVRDLITVMADGTNQDYLKPVGKDGLGLSPSSPLKQDTREDLWAGVPAGRLMNEVLKASLADGPGYNTLDHDVDETLTWLATDPVSTVALRGWVRNAHTVQSSLAHLDDHLSSTLGDLLVHTARRMEHLPATQRLIERIAEAKHWQTSAPEGWGFAGYTASSALKHSFVRWRSPQHDALFEALPSMFWTGVANEVTSSSGLGRWVSTNQMRPLLADPTSDLARTTVLKAWLALDKKRIETLEAVMPGCSQRWLTEVGTLQFRPGYPHRATLDTIPEALTRPHGRWALAVFRQAGAPVDPKDLRDDGLQAWHRANPGKLAQVLLGLHARMEARALQQSLEQDPSSPAMKSLPATRRERSRL